jgi:hypothetical protein
MKIIYYSIFWLIFFVFIRHIEPAGIVFYQGIISVIPVLLVYYFFHRANKNCTYEILIIFLLTYGINITIITTVDRAYSIKMLMWLEENSEGKTAEDLEMLFANNFIQAGGVSKRTDEQLASGNICKNDHGIYRLTERGEVLVKIFRYVKSMFNLK